MEDFDAYLAAMNHATARLAEAYSGTALYALAKFSEALEQLALEQQRARDRLDDDDRATYDRLRVEGHDHYSAIFLIDCARKLR